jgi:hypothetical protein
MRLPWCCAVVCYAILIEAAPIAKVTRPSGVTEVAELKPLYHPPVSLEIDLNKRNSEGDSGEALTEAQLDALSTADDFFKKYHWLLGHRSDDTKPFSKCSYVPRKTSL